MEFNIDEILSGNDDFGRAKFESYDLVEKILRDR